MSIIELFALAVLVLLVSIAVSVALRMSPPVPLPPYVPALVWASYVLLIVILVLFLLGQVTTGPLHLRS